jgi:signal recognition particle receptor subunit beta
MVLFNYSTKELTAKVVYYGPGLCGKTTNLQWIHDKLPIKNKGRMLSLATETDRTLFFDFLPIEIGSIRGMRTRIQLYTVPGQVFYNATRRMVLKGADAVVFVCDSQEALVDANRESYENMRQNLEANEIDPDEIPLVFQYNKRDLPNALPLEILNEQMNPQGAPFFEGVATKGVGVEDTLKAVTKLVFRSLSSRYGDGAQAPVSPQRAPAPPRLAPVLETPGPAPAVDAAAFGGGLGFTPAPAYAPAPERSATPKPVPVAPPFAPPAQFIPPPEASLPAAPDFGPAGFGAQAPRAAPQPAKVPAAAASSLPPFSRAAPAQQAAAPRNPAAPGPAVRTETPLSPPTDYTLPTPSFHAGDVPAPSSLGRHNPQSTLVSRADEADELRRRIAAPGMQEAAPGMQEAEEIDLEEIEELDARQPPPFASSFPPLPTETVAPPPAAVEKTAAAEIEVPLEIHVAPGTTKVNLKLKLVLNLKRR